MRAQVDLLAVKIRSWHLSHERWSGRHHTLCGRWVAVGGETRPELPYLEPSCNQCLLIAKRRGWVPPPVEDAFEPFGSAHEGAPV